ncbi:hypothetical protein TWF192_004759 [Orbilia oligospora]|nr:hypothetical protein TWF192_004759 [Orbilia oligospora]
MAHSDINLLPLRIGITFEDAPVDDRVPDVDHVHGTLWECKVEIPHKAKKFMAPLQTNFQQLSAFHTYPRHVESVIASVDLSSRIAKSWARMLVREPNKDMSGSGRRVEPGNVFGNHLVEPRTRATSNDAKNSNLTSSSFDLHTHTPPPAHLIPAAQRLWLSAQPTLSCTRARTPYPHERSQLLGINR